MVKKNKKVNQRCSCFQINLKKGSHVGAMTAFLIFITFLSFVYIILEPVSQSQKDNSLEISKFEKFLEGRLEKDLTTIRILINDEVNSSAGCLNLEYLPSTLGMNSFVKGPEGESLQIFQDESNIKIKQEGNNFLKLFYANETFSEEFVLQDDSSFISCDDLTSGDYEIKTWNKGRYFFENSLTENILENELELIDEFVEEFDLDFRGAFIKFENSEGDLIESNGENVLDNVFVEERFIEYVDEEGNIKIGKLYLGIW